MYQDPRVKTILQSYGNQNSMVVAPTSDTQLNGMKLRAQKYTHTWTISMQQMSKKIKWRKDSFSKKNGVQKTEQSHAKE